MDKDQLERAIADAHKQLAEQNKRINRLEAWMERQSRPRQQMMVLTPDGTLKPVVSVEPLQPHLNQSDPLAR